MLPRSLIRWKRLTLSCFQNRVTIIITIPLSSHSNLQFCRESVLLNFCERMENSSATSYYGAPVLRTKHARIQPIWLLPLRRDQRDANEDAHVRPCAFFNQHPVRLSGICWLFWSVSIVPRWVLTRHVAKIIVHARWRETSGVSTRKIAFTWITLIFNNVI